MIFSSITFLFYFLPFFLILYFLAPPKARNILLLIASLFFYAWGEIQYTAVLVLSICLNYIAGLWIGGHSGGSKKYALSVGIAANLLLLGYFKYFNFLFENISSLSSVFGLAQSAAAEVHLPLGISFFTFQAISYLVDVYRDENPAERNPLNVALYISMFPQLIAGPIVRFHSVATAIHSRSVTVNSTYLGIQIFIIGLAQKVLIANTMAVPADAIFSTDLTLLSTGGAWLGALSYTLQIYFDFAGYSNMAIGLGCILGFHFPQNFNYPYISKSITEFWRRWHMSLSSWLKDYLYIPLGGNRVGRGRLYFNLLTVFILCGLWHGASWTFVIWGLYHGFFLVIERMGLGKVLDKLWRPVRHAYALIVIIFGWVLFRSETITDALAYMKILVGFGATGDTALYGATQVDNLVTSIFIVGVLASASLFKRWMDLYGDVSTVEQTPDNASAALEFSRFGLLFAALILSIIALSAGTYNPFIYFRF